VRDLATGSVLRRGRIGCPRNAQTIYGAGNVIVAPAGDKLVLTCEMDGLAFDAKALRRTRVLPHLIPGCDNGPILPAHFSEDGSRLILEGCGGEARLDVATGKFQCGDADGLMGGDYEMLMPAPKRTRPPQASGVPPCRASANPSVSYSRLAAGYSREWGPDEQALVGPKGVRIVLPGNAMPVVAPTGDRFAYPSDDKVIVRSLPSGATLQELTF
jgi:hypothetical protein